MCTVKSCVRMIETAGWSKHHLVLAQLGNHIGVAGVDCNVQCGPSSPHLVHNKANQIKCVWSSTSQSEGGKNRVLFCESDDRPVQEGR